MQIAECKVKMDKNVMPAEHTSILQSAIFNLHSVLAATGAAR
jgi:hypothetical protein